MNVSLKYFCYFTTNSIFLLLFLLKYSNSFLRRLLFPSLNFEF